MYICLHFELNISSIGDVFSQLVNEVTDIHTV